MPPGFEAGPAPVARPALGGGVALGTVAAATSAPSAILDPANDPALRRGAGPQRAPLPTTVIDPPTGLYSDSAWISVVLAEEARWTRYGRPCQVMQVEVGGIAAVAEHLGDAAAERLLDLLAVVLTDETRGSDLYARTSRWRIQGILPEQEPAGGPVYETRVRDAFDRRLGPDLPFELVMGIASPSAGRGFVEALGAAERAMRPGSRPVATAPEPDVPAGSAPAQAPLAERVPASAPFSAASLASTRVPIPDRARAAGLREDLTALVELRDDGVITEDEYRAKRTELLERF